MSNDDERTAILVIAWVALLINDSIDATYRSFYSNGSTVEQFVLVPFFAADLEIGFHSIKFLTTRFDFNDKRHN